MWHRHRALVNATDLDFCTPLDHARDRTPVADLLREHGGRTRDELLADLHGDEDEEAEGDEIGPDDEE